MNALSKTKFQASLTTPSLGSICDYLLLNRQKLIWAIEDLDKPPFEGVGRHLVQLPGVDFQNPNIRRLVGTLITLILRPDYRLISSGHRVSWLPFLTSSKYEKQL